MKNIIALGAEKKTNFTGISSNGIYTSEPIENLDTIENLVSFEKNLKKYMEDNNIIPQYIACDSHPDYYSTRLAEKFHKRNINSEFIKIQHHFAHIVSCMFDNGIDEEVIGVSFDGTGYGSDGNSWGGEFLLCTRKDFSRLKHLKYVAQPGGDIAAKEGWRMAVSYLMSAFGNDFKNLKLNLFERIGRKKIDFIQKMIESDINSPMTSSVGRLFDAVSSIIGISDASTFEAESAILLEKKTNESITGHYGYKIDNLDIDVSGMIKEIVFDVQKGASQEIMSTKFHNTLGEVILSTSLELSKDTGIKKVLLSGGCFQNKYLTSYVTKRFEESGLKLFKHEKYSTTDLGISIGQAVIACSR